MATIKTARPPYGGIVIREIELWCERAYWLRPDGQWAIRHGHKGPWLSAPEREVPERIRAAAGA